MKYWLLHGAIENRSARGKAAGCDEFPGHESIVWPPMVDIVLLVGARVKSERYHQRYWQDGG